MNVLEDGCVVGNAICKFLDVHCPHTTEPNFDIETVLLIDLFHSLLPAGHHVIHQWECRVLLHLNFTSNESLPLHVEVRCQSNLIEHGCFDVLVIFNQCAGLVGATGLVAVDLHAVEQGVLSNHREVTGNQLLHEHFSICSGAVIGCRDYFLQSSVVPIHNHVDVVLNQHGAVFGIQLTESHLHRVRAHEDTVLLNGKFLVQFQPRVRYDNLGRVVVSIQFTTTTTIECIQLTLMFCHEYIPINLQHLFEVTGFNGFW